MVSFIDPEIEEAQRGLPCKMSNQSGSTPNWWCCCRQRRVGQILMITFKIWALSHLAFHPKASHGSGVMKKDSWMIVYEDVTKFSQACPFFGLGTAEMSRGLNCETCMTKSVRYAWRLHRFHTSCTWPPFQHLWVLIDALALEVCLWVQSKGGQILMWSPSLKIW